MKELLVDLDCVSKDNAKQMFARQRFVRIQKFVMMECASHQDVHQIEIVIKRKFALAVSVRDIHAH